MIQTELDNQGFSKEPFTFNGSDYSTFKGIFHAQGLHECRECFTDIDEDADNHFRCYYYAAKKGFVCLDCYNERKKSGEPHAGIMRRIMERAGELNDAELSELLKKFSVRDALSDSVGFKIRKLRTEAGETQEQLGEILGVTKQCVGRWESDKRKPDMTVKRKIAAHYGVPRQYLLSN